MGYPLPFVYHMAAGMMNKLIVANVGKMVIQKYCPNPNANEKGVNQHANH